MVLAHRKVAELFMMVAGAPVRSAIASVASDHASATMLPCASGWLGQGTIVIGLGTRRRYQCDQCAEAVGVLVREMRHDTPAPSKLAPAAIEVLSKAPARLPSSSGLGRGPLAAETRVRFP